MKKFMILAAVLLAASCAKEAQTAYQTISFRLGDVQSGEIFVLGKVAESSSEVVWCFTYVKKRSETVFILLLLSSIIRYYCSMLWKGKPYTLKLIFIIYNVGKKY